MGGKSGRTRKYPWDKWFTRKGQFILIKGKHFSCESSVMAQQFRNKSYMEGKKVSIQTKGDQLLIKVTNE